MRPRMLPEFSKLPPNMSMQKMNRVILLLLSLVFASALPAQGPPVRVSSFTVESNTRFGEIPAPTENFDLAKYAPEASTVSGTVHIHYPKVKIGKFKKGSMTVILRNKVVTSVSLVAPSKKSVSLLLEQLRKQFGDPYKLQSHKSRHYINWLSDRKSKIDIRFESDEAYSQATATIDRK